MKAAAADVPAALTTKSAVVLATIPVGANGAPPVAGGRCTTRAPPVGCATPAPSYSVDVLVPLLAIHTGAPGRNVMPQGFTRLASTVTEPLAVSWTRFFTTNCVAGFTVRVTDMELLPPFPP